MAGAAPGQNAGFKRPIVFFVVGAIMLFGVFNTWVSMSRLTALENPAQPTRLNSAISRLTAQLKSLEAKQMNSAMSGLTAVENSVKPTQRNSGKPTRKLLEKPTIVTSKPSRQLLKKAMVETTKTTKAMDMQDSAGVQRSSPAVEETQMPRGPKNARQEAVRDMMKHAWLGYRTYAWGQDELYPETRRAGNGWHVGLTIVDGLDTLYLLGMDDEFKEAKEWVRDKLDFSRCGNVNLFETTIRVLGGLLGAEALTGDTLFLEKARDLGNRLLLAFTGNGVPVPYSDINLRTGSGQWLESRVETSQITSVQLEFKTLSHITGNRTYAAIVDRVSRHIRQLPKTDGLIPQYLSPYSHSFTNSRIGFGAGGDSYYEYLLKQWLLTGKSEVVFLNEYREAMRGMHSRLLQRSRVGARTLGFVGTLENNRYVPQMDHLVCFLAGTLALGNMTGGGGKDDSEVAEEIMAACYEMYKTTASGLAPEIAFFNQQGGLTVKPADAFSLLRPEAVESLFYLYRITKNPMYQDWGWNIFQALEKHAKIRSGGYSSLRRVDTSHPTTVINKMESFFVAETVKYLFLLFDTTSSQVPLDKFVFNTEAHPLRIYTS